MKKYRLEKREKLRIDYKNWVIKRRNEYKKYGYVKCKCGCGTSIPKISVNGKRISFVTTHNYPKTI